MSSSLKAFLLSVLILPCAFIFSACGDKASKIEVKNVEVTGVTASFKVNDDFTIGDNAKVTITTSDDKKIVYDTTGLIYDNDKLTATADKYIIDYSKYNKTQAGTYSIVVKSKEKLDITFEYDVVVSLFANTWATVPSISNWEYGQTASVPVGTATNGSVVFEYKLANAEDNSYSTTAPTNAGAYKMRASVGATSVYAELKQEVAFNITKAKVANPTADTTVFTYNGIEQTYNFNGIILDKMTVTNNKRTDAGTQQVSVALIDADNYEWETPTATNVLSFEFVIAQATNSWETPLSIANWTYGGTASVPTGVAKFGQIVFEYKLASAQDTAYSTTVPTNAGGYKLRGSVQATNNYSALKQEIEFIIEKVALAKPTADTTEFYYNGQEQTYNVNCEFPSLLNITDNVKTDAGDYNVLVDIIDKENYGWYNGQSSTIPDSISFQFIIKKANNNWTTSPSIANWTYGQTPSVPTAVAKYGQVVFEYKIVANDSVYSTTVPINVGDYIVKASTIASSNYYGISSTREFKILKASVTKPTANTTAFTYNGNEQTYNVVSDDTTKFSVSNNVKTNAGTYSVVVALLDTENYQWADGTTTDLTFEFVIAIQKLAKPTADTTSFVYNTQEQTYNVVSEDATKFTVENNVQTNVGTYNVIVSLIDTINYQWADGTITALEFSFEIAKQVVEIPVIAHKIYTGETLTAEVPSSPYYRARINSGGVEAGRYEVIVALIDISNYKWKGNDNLEVRLNFWIVTNENSWNEPFAFSGWIYGETPNEPSANAQYGKAQFTYMPVGNPDPIWTTVQPIRAGNYYIKARVEATTEYSWLEQIVEFTIAQAEVASPSIPSSEYNGVTQIAEISSNDIYEVIENDGGTDVGEYDVKLQLKNTNNYKWKTNDSVVDNVLTLKFNITQATNYWVYEIFTSDFTYGETMYDIFGLSKFGQVVFDFKVKGEDDSTYTTNEPTEVGEYVLRGRVQANENWTALEDTFEFSINKIMVWINENYETVKYNGKTQKANIDSDDDYIALDNNGFINVGEYEITLQLKDADHYTWINSSGIIDGENFKVKFVIEKGEPTSIPTIDVVIAYVGDYPTSIQLPEGFSIIFDSMVTPFTETGLVSYNGKYQDPDYGNYNPVSVSIVVAVYDKNLENFTANDFIIEHNAVTYEKSRSWSIKPVELINNAIGATISYSKIQNSIAIYDQNLSSEIFKFSVVGEYNLFFRVEKENFNPYYGYATLTINKKDLNFTQMPRASSYILIDTKLSDIYVFYECEGIYCEVVWDNPDATILEGAHSYPVTLIPDNQNFKAYRTNIEIYGMKIILPSMSINGTEYKPNDLYCDIAIEVDRLSDVEVSFVFDDEKYSIVTYDKTLITESNTIYKFKFNQILGDEYWAFAIDEKSRIDAFILSDLYIYEADFLQFIDLYININEHIKKVEIIAGDSVFEKSLNTKTIVIETNEIISAIDVEVEKGYIFDMYLNGKLFDKQVFNNNVFKYGLNILNIVVKDTNNVITNYYNVDFCYSSMQILMVNADAHDELLYSNIIYTYGDEVTLLYNEDAENYIENVEENGSVKFYRNGAELIDTTITLQDGLNAGFYAEITTNDGGKIVHEFAIYKLGDMELSKNQIHLYNFTRIVGPAQKMAKYYMVKSDEQIFADRPLSLNDIQIRESSDEDSPVVENSLITLSDDGKYLTVKIPVGSKMYVNVYPIENLIQIPIDDFKVDMYIYRNILNEYQLAEFDSENKAYYDVQNDDILYSVDFGSNAIIKITGECIKYMEEYGLYYIEGDFKEYTATIEVSNFTRSIVRTYELILKIKPTVVLSMTPQKQGTTQTEKTLTLHGFDENEMPILRGDISCKIDIENGEIFARYFDYISNFDTLGSDGELFELNKLNTDGNKYVAFKFDYFDVLIDGITRSEGSQEFVDKTSNLLVMITEKDEYYEGIIYLYQSEIGYIPINIYLAKENVQINNIEISFNISMPITDVNSELVLSNSTNITKLGELVFTEGKYSKEGYELNTGKFVGFDETYFTKIEDGMIKVYSMNSEYLGKLDFDLNSKELFLFEAEDTFSIPLGTKFIATTTGIPYITFTIFNNEIVNFYKNSQDEATFEITIKGENIIVQHATSFNANNEARFELVEDKSCFTPFIREGEIDITILLNLTLNQGTENESNLMIVLGIIGLPYM